MISVIFFTVSFPYFGLLKSNDDLVFTGLWPLLYVNIVFLKFLPISFFVKKGLMNFQKPLLFLGNFIYISFDALVFLIFNAFYFLHLVASVLIS